MSANMSFGVDKFVGEYHGIGWMWAAFRAFYLIALFTADTCADRQGQEIDLRKARIAAESESMELGAVSETESTDGQPKPIRDVGENGEQIQAGSGKEKIAVATAAGEDIGVGVIGLPMANKEVRE
jgi:hypothetical protein